MKIMNTAAIDYVRVLSKLRKKKAFANKDKANFKNENKNSRNKKIKGAEKTHSARQTAKIWSCNKTKQEQKQKQRTTFSTVNKINRNVMVTFIDYTGIIYGPICVAYD